MQEVSGPVVAIVLVLCAVFVPVSFLGGLAGELYRQFAITIAVSVVISGIVALTLTPALCALLLKPGHGEPWLPFRVFNRGFDWLTRRFIGGAAFFLRHAVVALAVVALMLGATWWLFQRVPGGARAGRGPGLRLPRDACCRRPPPSTGRPDHGAGHGRRDAEPGGRRAWSRSRASTCCPARRRPMRGCPSSP